MDKIKIYCDSGGYQPWLKDVKFHEKIIITHFPFEQINKRIQNKSSPSGPMQDQMNLKWDEAMFSWNGTLTSNKFTQIIKIVGKQNYCDAQHLDTAYKNNCKIFITSDRGDILFHKEKLEELLDIKFFHHTEQSLLHSYLSEVE